MSDIRTLVDVYTKAAHTAGSNGDGTATLHIDPEAGVKAVVARLQEWIDHHIERADKAERILGEGVRMAAAMNMTAGWVDSAKQILGGKS